MTSQSINLNLIPGAVKPIINVSQYDKGQTWLFDVYAGSQTFSIPSGTTVTIQGTKADNTGFQYTCTFSGNVVTAIEQQQMTVFPGKVECELVLTKGAELIGSLNFVLIVEPAALRDDTIISDTELPLIEQAAEIATQIEEDLIIIEGYKEDSEAWANGTRNGTPIGSSDPAYHKNAKYYVDNFVGYVTDTQYTAINTLFNS